MKVIVAGSRAFDNYYIVKKALDNLLKNIPKEDIEIISGNCWSGVDKLGERYANEYGLKLTKFPAEWSKYGKAAGPIRNEEMAKYADNLLAIWNGVSKGTKSMISLATQYKLKVQIIYTI